MKQRVLTVVTLCVMLWGGAVFAKTGSGRAVLENPASDSHQSGVSVISGWACDAQEIVVEIDGKPFPAAYGTARTDTHSVCGDTDNGFSFLWNWGNSGPGEHTVRALSSGVEFGRATITVTTFGTAFLRDARGVYSLTDFPTLGEETRIEWNEALQNFVIRDNPTKFTRDFVQAALNRYDEQGREATLAYYNDPANAVDEWYVFIIDDNDLHIAHPFRPDLIGQDIKTIVGSNGYALGREIAKATEGGHWIHYPWSNPTSGREDPKHSWAIRHDGLIFASGYYDIRGPAAFTRDFVQAALDRYDEQGREATLAHYNDPKSVEGAWYVFIIDDNDLIVSQPVDPTLVGRDIKTIVGSNGYALGREIAKATEGGHWIHYPWPNPVSGQEELKHSWVIRHDGFIFGSGFYGER